MSGLNRTYFIYICRDCSMISLTIRELIHNNGTADHLKENVFSRVDI